MWFAIRGCDDMPPAIVKPRARRAALPSQFRLQALAVTNCQRANAIRGGVEISAADCIRLFTVHF